MRYVLIALIVALTATLFAMYLSPPKEANGTQVALVTGDTTGRLPDARSLRNQLALLQRDLRRIAPREPYIVINTHASRLALRTNDSILFEAVCSAGSGAELIDSTTGRRWVFDTPPGMYKVSSKIKDPWWRKPDWAFVEENEPLPTDEEERMDPRMMGEYAIGFGDGFFIHGTIYERLLGVNVTHGCVRLGAEDLRRLYNKVSIGTRIYVF